MYQHLCIEWVVGLTAIVMLTIEAWGIQNRRILAYIGAASLVLAGVLGLWFNADVASGWNWWLNSPNSAPPVVYHLLGAPSNVPGQPPNGSYILDATSLFFKELMLLITMVALLISVEYVEREIKRPGEFYVLFMFVCLGMLFLCSAGDLITIFISLEIVSMPLYVLAASMNYNQRSTEAGMKFFVLGALASALYLFGASMLFGSLGTLYLHEFPHALRMIGPDHVVVYFGLVCVLAAFSFKIAAAPFHMWAPDVYQGAPTPVTAFLSTGPKVAGVAILMRLLLGAFNNIGLGAEHHLKQDWILILSVLALLSMTVGNLVAMHQTNIKRMMAFSGIAHMGYMLVGLAAASSNGSAALMFYIFLYTLTTLGAWAVVILYSLAVGSDEIRDMAGMSQRSPALAAILMLLLLSLAGLPPLAGFVGKFYLFAAAWDSGLEWLAVFGILNSVASLFYYLGVLKVVYFEPPATDEPLHLGSPYQFALALSTVAVVVLGLCPFMTQWTLQIASTFVRY